MADKFKTVSSTQRSLGRRYKPIAGTDRFVELADTKIGSEVSVGGDKALPALASVAALTDVDTSTVIGIAALALTLIAPASVYARVDQEFRFTPAPINISGSLKVTRTGAALPQDFTFNDKTGEIVGPAAAVNKPMVFETGRLDFVDDRGIVVSAPTKTILVSDMEFAPIYPSGNFGYGLNPADNSLPTWNNHSAFSVYSMSQNEDGRVRRYAITGQGERWKPNGVTVEANQRSEAKGNLVYPFGSTFSFAWGQRDYGFVGALRLNPADWHIMRQIHVVTETGDAGTSPPIELMRVDENNIVLVTRFTDVVPLLAGSDGKSVKTYGPFPCAQGVRHTVVLEGNMGNGDGRLTLALDGVRLIDESNLKLGYVGRANYDKEGVYRGFGNVGFPGYAIEIDNLRKSNTVSLLDYIQNPARLDGSRLKPIATQPATITGTLEVGRAIQIKFPTVPFADKLSYSIRSSAAPDTVGGPIAGGQGDIDPGAVMNFAIPAGQVGRYLNVAYHPIRDYQQPNEQRGVTIQSANVGPISDAAAIAVTTPGRVTRDADGSVGQKYRYQRAVWADGGQGTLQWSRIRLGSEAETIIVGATGEEYTATSEDIGFIPRCTESRNANSVTRARHPGPVLEASILLEGFESIAGFTLSANMFVEANTQKKRQGSGAMNAAWKIGASGTQAASKVVSKSIDPTTLGIVTAEIGVESPVNSAASVNFDFAKSGETGVKVNIALGGGADDYFPTWLHGFVDVADLAAGTLIADTADRNVRASINVVRNPSFGRVTFDNFRARQKGVPTVIPYFDDGYLAPFTKLAQYARDRGVFLNYAIPVDNLSSSPGSGKMSMANVLAADQMGHGVCINFTRDDNGPRGSFTRQNFVNGALSSVADLKAAGVSDRCLYDGVWSNSAASMNYEENTSINATFAGDNTMVFPVNPNVDTTGKYASITLGDQIVGTNIPDECFVTGRNEADPKRFTLSKNVPANASVTGTATITRKRTPIGSARVLDAIHDGAGNVTLGSTPTIAPRVGFKWVGWDATTGLMSSANIIAVTDATHFKLDVNVPANGALTGTAFTNSKRGMYWGEDYEFFGRKLGNALQAAGFRTGRLTAPWDHRRITRGGIPDPMFEPAQGYTSKRFADVKAAAEDAKKYGYTLRQYFHDAPEVGETQGIGFFAQDWYQYIDYLAAEQQAGNLMTMRLDQHWQRDGGASWPLAA